MSADDHDTPREALLRVLMHKVEVDPYPSATMLDVIESLLTDDDVPAYAELLVSKIDEDLFPSTSLIRRVQAMA